MKNIIINKIDNKNILIVKMNKSMLYEVSQIASKTLGSSFVNEDILDNDINLCSKIDEKIVAYGTTKFIDINYLEKIIKDNKLQLDKEYKSIGYIDSIAVDQNYSGYGIGTLLLKDTISKLRENKIGFAIMAGWINKDQVNIKRLAIKEGFKEEFIIEDFWKEDSLKFNFDCTACGKPPCLCSAIIYTKKL
ncbi:GNAT family N-acetyltransferase [Aliarcobacter cryaerophilus]|uniref:GNAT family N-acetyltransferase n=1 Tax=Aliarcobacter cryaerophilus TaxID=28198 RepID=UPI0013DE052D|nr:GNAT family N-acetyltransferase [Aliarcobacter cryaerophilus]